MAMLSTGNAGDDDTKVLQGIGIPVSKLLAFLRIIKTTIGRERINECNDELQLACREAGIDPEFLPQYGLVIESTLCLHGLDVSNWTTVWSTVVKSMMTCKTMPPFSRLFDKEIASALEPSPGDQTGKTHGEPAAGGAGVEVKEEAA